MSRIHPTAIVDPKARLADGVEVGPFCVIGPTVRIGAKTWIGSHVVIEGDTRIGSGNRIFHHAVIGSLPQDKMFHGEESRLEIGDGNVIREFVTIQPGTAKQDGVTRVGSGNWFLTGVHIAHDCAVGDETTFSNWTSLAGHVEVASHASLSAYVGIHQFCRIGRYAMVGGASVVIQDVPPFVLAQGDHARLRGLNRVGLRRAKVDDDRINAIAETYRKLFRSEGALQTRLKAAQATADPWALEMVEFAAVSKRGICRHGKESPEP